MREQDIDEAATYIVKLLDGLLSRIDTPNPPKPRTATKGIGVRCNLCYRPITNRQPIRKVWDDWVHVACWEYRR